MMLEGQRSRPRMKNMTKATTEQLITATIVIVLETQARIIMTTNTQNLEKIMTRIHGHTLTNAKMILKTNGGMNWNPGIETVIGTVIGIVEIILKVLEINKMKDTVTKAVKGAMITIEIEGAEVGKEIVMM